MNLNERVCAPTPKFFQKIRNIGLVLAAVSGTVLAAPVAMPLIVMKLAGYLGVASMVASAVSQTAVCEEPEQKKDNEGNGQ